MKAASVSLTIQREDLPDKNYSEVNVVTLVLDEEERMTLLRLLQVVGEDCRIQGLYPDHRQMANDLYRAVLLGKSIG